MASKNVNVSNKTRRDSTWRRFEDLVAEIERHLAPDEAIIQLDDKVPDLVTGNLRQVDATIRYKVGSIDILVAIECRRRGSKQDITWIEQLKTKRESIGASRIVGVSSEGFSELALTKARHFGIALRRLGKIDVAKFVERFILEIKHTRHKHKHTKFDFDTSDPLVLDYLNEMINSREVEDNKKPFIWLIDLNRMLTMQELVDIFYRKSEKAIGKVSRKKHDSESFEIRVPKGHMYVLTPFGKIFLKRFMLVFDYQEKTSILDTPTEFSYRDESETEISRIYEFTTEDLDGEVQYLRHIEKM